MILDAGLNLMGTTAPFSRIHVGTGTSTPSYVQTALDARIAETTINQGTNVYVAGTEPFVQNTFSGRFNAGVAAGNLAEIGVGNAITSGNPLFSRARILDLNGQPTVITVLADEYLDVEYTIKLYPSLVDTTGSVVISGTTYNWTSRSSRMSSPGVWRAGMIGSNVGVYPSSIAAYRNASLAAMTAQISGNNLGSQSGVAQPYINNSLNRSGQASAALSAWNHANGISGFSISGGGYYSYTEYQMVISPVLPKDDTKSIVLTFNESWGRK
jgi:hypothetical protein